MLIASFARLSARGQQAVQGAHRAEIGPFVEQGGIDGRRRGLGRTHHRRNGQAAPVRINAIDCAARDAQGGTGAGLGDLAIVSGHIGTGGGEREWAEK